MALLADETVAIRENASRREEQHRQDLAEAEQTKQAAELAEVAAREEAAAAVERLEAAAREQRERTEKENAESLTRALEEMERQQSGVLSAALARSDAALREVARVKEVRSGRRWEKKADNFSFFFSLTVWCCSWHRVFDKPRCFLRGLVCGSIWYLFVCLSTRSFINSSIN